MHSRDFTPRTLTEIAEEWGTHHRTWNSDACTPTVDFQEDAENPVFLLGALSVALDRDSTARLCTFYGIPTAFFRRLVTAEKHSLLNSRIDHAVGEITVTYNRHGLVDVRRPSQPRLEPEHILAAAERAMPPGSEVVDAWWTSDDMRLDILAPLTGGRLDNGMQRGLRFSQNRKTNLSPTVRPLLLDTASGCFVEIPDRSLRIDARGQSVEKIADLLGGEALRAASRVADDAEAFRALSHVSLATDRVTRLNRIASEHGMPARPLAAVTAAVCAAESPTLRDVVLAISGAANAPALVPHSKRGLRTRLQAVAGAVVTDHAVRCRSCYATMPAA